MNAFPLPNFLCRAVAGWLLLTGSALATSVIQQPEPSAFDATETLVAVSHYKSSEPRSTLSVYHVASGQRVREFEFTEERIWDIAFCGRESLIIATERGIYRGEMHSSSDTRKLVPIEKGSKATISPDCKRAAVFGPERRGVLIVSLENPRSTRIIANAVDIVAACYFNDGRHLGLLDSAGGIAISDVASGEKRKVAMQEETFGIGCIADHVLAVGSSHVLLYGIRSKAKTSEYPVFCDISGRTCGISLSAELIGSVRDAHGKKAASLGLFSMKTRSHVETINLPGPPTGLSLSSSGRLIVVTFDEGAPMLIRLNAEKGHRAIRLVAR